MSANDYLQRVAGELADLALADEDATQDEKIVKEIGDILGASSQTLQEGYLTAIRVRRAETRAREILQERAAKRGPTTAKLLPNDGPSTPDQPDQDIEAIELGNGPTEAPAPAPEAPVAPVTQPKTEEEAAFDDVLNTLDEFLQTDDKP